MSSGIEWRRPATPSTPEPAPENRGFPVTPELISFLMTTARHHTPTINPCPVVELLRERDAFGREKYGQPLMSDDGRNSVEDAMQEFGDLLQYTFKARVNNDDLSRLREMKWALDVLLAEE